MQKNEKLEKTNEEEYHDCSAGCAAHEDLTLSPDVPEPHSEGGGQTY